VCNDAVLHPVYHSVFDSHSMNLTEHDRQDGAAQGLDREAVFRESSGIVAGSSVRAQLTI
jgi:hypothetical protein